VFEKTGGWKPGFLKSELEEDQSGLIGFLERRDSNTWAGFGPAVRFHSHQGYLTMNCTSKIPPPVQVIGARKWIG